MNNGKKMELNINFEYRFDGCDHYFGIVYCMVHYCIISELMLSSWSMAFEDSPF